MSSLEEIRKAEYPQLEDVMFFDFAGSMPPCTSQSKKLVELQMEGVSNPHSQAQINRSTVDMEDMRYIITDLCKTSLETYEVCLTQNATQAIQKWSELFNWTEKSHFSYLIDDHNSILGVRAMATKKGVSVSCEKGLPEVKEGNRCVFAYPMQSNFSGKKYPIEWITEYQNKGGFVFLDGAAATAPDLSVHKPDFVCLSLLKLSGAHGGALLVRRDRIDMLGESVPAGGNVLFSCARSGVYKLLPTLHQRIEAGTQSYIDISLALKGLEIRRKIGTEDEIKSRLSEISSKFYNDLKELKHNTGLPLVHFTPEREDSYGPVFSFNLFDANGYLISYQDVQYLFSVFNVVARFGGHCNPGSGFPALGWKEEDIEKIAEENEKGGKCLSSLCEIQGRPVGTIRISFGSTTTSNDCDRLVALMKHHFLNGGPCPPVGDVVVPMTIQRLFIFPVQSAPGFEVKEWKLTPFGLLHDRMWKIMDASGVQLRTTNCTPVATLKPTVEGDKLKLRINGEEIAVPIDNFEELAECPEKVKESGQVYKGEVNHFLSKHLSRCCYLVKCDPTKIGKMAFSAVTEESMQHLNPGFDIWRLRINLLLNGAPAFSEEGEVKGKLQIADVPITAWRWRIICNTSSVDIETGISDKSIFREILNERSRNGAFTFGVLFATNTNSQIKDIKVGDKITNM